MVHEEGRDGSEAAGRGADVDEGIGRTALMVAASALFNWEPRPDSAAALPARGRTTTVH